jgi:hypothetical protein
MNDETILQISPSLFELKEMRNLPRGPIDELKAKILAEYRALSTDGEVNDLPVAREREK